MEGFLRNKKKIAVTGVVLAVLIAIGRVVWNDLEEHFDRTGSNYLKTAFLLCGCVLVIGSMPVPYTAGNSIPSLPSVRRVSRFP